MTVECTADPGAKLEACDYGRKKRCAIDLGYCLRLLGMFRCSEQSWQYNRVGMPWGMNVDIVKLESLDEGPV